MNNNKQLAICIVTPAMPPIIGGAETFAEVLVLSLVRKKQKIFLVTAKSPRLEVIQSIEELGGKIFALGETFEAVDGYVAWEWAAFSRSKTIHNILCNYQIDIVHALSHDCIVSARIALEDEKFKKDIPLVITTSEMSTEDTEFGKARSKFIYNLKIDGLLQLSKYYMNLALSYDCKSKVKAIAAAVDIELFKSGNKIRGRKFIDIDENSFLITCPSRFSKRKGQIELLQALNQMPFEIKKTIICLLAGDINSASKKYQHEIIELSKKIDVRCLILSIPRTKMPDIYAASDLVVIPSSKEGLGFAAIESMAAGCPVLLSKVSGFDEIPDGENQVMYFDLSNSNDLKYKIEELIINCDLRDKLIKNGRKSVLKRFSFENFASITINLYRNLLDFTHNSDNIQLR
ncbi:MAG: glycosyltransferase family 4 protein [Firmicutes bacterium]|nr:glycosyltransferase family 4 protein [Bacillota bacterium]